MSKLKNLYRTQFQKYGVDPRSLFWSKGRQKIRFQVLSEHIHSGMTILDYGCGFGDFYSYLKSKNIDVNYIGIDIVDEFIHEAQKIHSDGTFLIRELNNDYLDLQIDYAVASGTFNLLYVDNEVDHERIVFEAIAKLYSLAAGGVSVDFLTPDVDYKAPGGFHMDYSKIMSWCINNLSRRIKLDHSYLPYEYCIHILNDQYTNETSDQYYGS